MDLSPFLLINPCGYPDLETIDMETLGVHVAFSEVAEDLVKELTHQLS
jgi:lipoyl(octanoyl) transferase